MDWNREGSFFVDRSRRSAVVDVIFDGVLCRWVKTLSEQATLKLMLSPLDRATMEAVDESWLALIRFVLADIRPPSAP
jgi:hypothetical protein